MVTKKEFELVDLQNASPWIDVPLDWRKPDTNESYQLFWDSKRGFGQILPRPSVDDVMSFYDVDEYYTHDARKKKDTVKIGFSQKLQSKFSWWADSGIEPNKDWWDSVLVRKNMRILEVGCGNGSNLSIFKSLGHEAIGVEPDIAALEVAREQGHSVFQGTAEDLPKELLQESFDAVVFMHVLEHCVDPFVAVKNAVEILKPGGTFVAEVPNNECLGAKKFKEVWYWLDVPRHLNFFTAQSLDELVSSVGLRRNSICYRGYCRQFGRDWKESQSQIASVMRLENDARTNSLSYWRYLFQTVISKDERKFDSVRIVADL